MSRRAVAILAASAVLQLALAALPDTMGDLLDYRVWTRALARDGLAAAYWPPSASTDSAELTPAVDYPPLFPYLLWGLGKLIGAVSRAALDDDRLLDFLIRLPLVGANLLIAVLVHRETLRIAPASADLGLGLMALNPALVFDTAYWGQADALCVLLVTSALILLVRGRPEWAWASLAAGVLLKPVAAPLAPLVVLETFKRFGPGRALRSALAAFGVALAAFLPFLAIGRLEAGLAAVFGQVEAMPYVSVNAHNVWWLVGRGLPWTEAAVRPWGLLSWKSIGLVLFGAVGVWTLLKLWRAAEPRAAYVAAATTALGFFVLSTHMHENHLLVALPLLALAAAGPTRARGMLIVASLASFANMLLHDPYLTHLARPLVPGPQLLLPQQLGLHPRLAEYLAHHGYPWVVEEIRGETTLVGLLATLVSAQAHVMLLVVWILHVRGGFAATRATGMRWPPERRWAAAGAAFVLATGLPFVRRELSYGREHAVLVHFSEAEVRTDIAEGVGIRSWEIGGERRYVLFVHPRAEVRYRLTPPADARLRFGLAVDPAAWSPSKGDGVRFEIRVEADGASRTVFSREIDPKHDPRDQRWHDAEVDLSTEAGREVTLVFSTTGGALGNIDFDWAGFSDPTFVGH